MRMRMHLPFAVRLPFTATESNYKYRNFLSGIARTWKIASSLASHCVFLFSRQFKIEKKSWNDSMINVHAIYV